MKKDLSFSSLIISLATTNSQALFLFSAAIGAVFIFTNFHVLILPPLIVIIYAIILFIAQRKFFVSLSEQNRDSSYLLGFLFTLMSFVRIFYGLEAVSMTFSTVIVPQIGSALLTSVFGLIGRFVIIHNDRGSADQEEIWRNATNELKENSKAYRNAQKKLTELIDHFVETREKLLAEEQKASKDHITSISKSSNALAVISKDYPPVIKDLLASLDEIKNKYEIVQAKSEKFLSDNIFDKYDKLDGEITAYYETVNKRFVALHEDAFAQISPKLIGLKENIDQFSDSFQQSFKQFPDIQDQFIKRSIDKLETMHGEFLTKLNSNFQKLNATIEKIESEMNSTNNKLTGYNQLMGDGIESNIGSIKNNISELSTTLSAFNNSLSQSSTLLDKNISSINENIIKCLKTFNTEIKEIDDLIDSFIKATKERITQ